MSDQPHAREFERDVIRIAKLLHWRVAHFRPVLTKHGWKVPVAADGQGFPDLLCVRDRVIAAELKTGKARLEPPQIEWKDAFEGAAGCSYHLWRPDDWDDILAILRHTGAQPAACQWCGRTLVHRVDCQPQLEVA